ncbi:MAG: carboxypeptidase-like regulatory domain-containing protein [Terracidiphilus sp.]|nr:carboxypeptidase-like regulatory domain-containing protein [Terracidiphilus sp.]
MSTARSTVRGVVRNSQGGAGVARARVQIEGDAETGALTDGDGRFELRDVPVGPQSFTVDKPGYQDLPFGGAAVEQFSGGEGSERFRMGGNHNVIVADGMPELVFTLAPSAAIRGLVQSANGEPLAGITVQLAWRTIEDGRAIWQLHGETKTRFDGRFRFGGLNEGVYALFTSPQIEDEVAELDATDAAENSEATNLPQQAKGYPAIYYPDAREPGGAGRIPLAAGQDAQVTLNLPEEIFHRVTVPVSADTPKFVSSLQDANGRCLPYSARSNMVSHALEALLPDGSYQVLVTSFPEPPTPGVRRHREDGPYAGLLEFTVAGKTLKTRSVSLGPQRPGPVEVTLLRGGTGRSGAADENGEIVVLANQASGWVDDGVASAFASGPVGSPLDATYTVPGSYWLHAQIPQKGFCEGSFTAGGASLAHEPVRVPLGGTTAPLTLAVRRDCAELALRLPPATMAFGAGEEPYYTAWVVPDFDFTQNLTSNTLRPTSGDSVTVSGLAPGNYHVYVFAGPHPLEYHNREALAGMKGQSVTLEPEGTAELVLEVPGR